VLENVGVITPGVVELIEIDLNRFCSELFSLRNCYAHFHKPVVLEVAGVLEVTAIFDTKLTCNIFRTSSRIFLNLMYLK